MNDTEPYPMHGENPQAQHQARLFALGQAQLGQAGWRQALLLTAKDQAVASSRGDLTSAFKRLWQQPVSHADTLWMLTPQSLASLDLKRLQHLGVDRLVALSPWADLAPPPHLPDFLTLQLQPIESLSQLNRGQYRRSQCQRPWVTSTLALSAQGCLGSCGDADKTGFMQQWMKRFDACFLPWQGSDLTQNWYGPPRLMVKTVADQFYVMQGPKTDPLLTTSDAKALLDWCYQQGMSEVCLDGLDALSGQLMAQGWVDETRQLLLGQVGESQFDVMGASILQTTVFKPQK